MLNSISINTEKRIELIEITKKVQDIIELNNVKEGICTIFCPHTTAALTINENADPSVSKDIISGLNRIAPEDNNYEHVEGNADSHIKSSLVGSSLSVIIDGGKLLLGTWQGIFFCEFDGPRQRRVFVKVK